MSSTTSNGLRIIRQRIFIKHTSPEEREIVDEITILNESDGDIENIFLFRKDFMVGLKILDSTDEEIPFYTNEQVRDVLSRPGKTILGTPTYVNAPILQTMKKREIFALWIKLNKSNLIKSAELKIIKLSYRNKTKPMKLNFLDTFYNHKFLFNIPRFRTLNTKLKSDEYDTFYIITAPEGFKLDYEINKNVIIKDDGQQIPLNEKNGVHTNYDEKTFSLRMPSLGEKNEFDMVYDIIPSDNERWFYAITVFSMIGLSTFTTILALKWIDPSINIVLTHIYNHANHIFAGIITASLAAIGLSKDSSTVRTRFWFLVPMAISAIGALFKI